MFGYCCTGSVVIARHPTSTITRFTTTARTGCLMNVSVKERMNGFRLASCVSRDQHSLAQLEGPRGSYLLTGGETTQNHDFVVEHRPALHRLHVRAAPPARVRDHQEDVVTGRPLAEGAHRNRDDRRRGSYGDFDAHRGARRRCAARDPGPH